MLASKLQPYFLAGLIGGTALLAFFVLLPFLSVLALAAAAAVAVYPLHRKILALAGHHAGIAAFCTVLLVIAFAMIPLTLLGVRIFNEASQVYFSFTGNGAGSALLNAVRELLARVQEAFPGIRLPSPDFGQYAREALGWLVQNGSAVFSNLVNVFTGIFIFIVALYYFLKDGKRFMDMVHASSPLRDGDSEALFAKLEHAVNSVMRGSLAMAIVQGILAGLGFFIFGVPGAIFWGSVAAVASLIPVIGTALVVIPAAAFLFLTGHGLAALGLLLWGVAGIGIVDNLLRPQLIGRGIALHPLLVFLSVLGGIAFFGPSGFLLGPLTVSFLLALFDSYFDLANAKMEIS